MCSICGIADFCGEGASPFLAGRMGEAMSRRGPDQNGAWNDKKVAFQHNRLAVIDIENGRQPMTRAFGGREYTIVYNGELYNTPELTEELKLKGVSFETRCDTEAVLYAYIIFGEDCAAKLNGIFAFAVYDREEEKVFFARDRLGVKPLFFALKGSKMLFSSEIKALLNHPEVKREIDIERLWQLLFLSPVRLPGTGVFRDICELEPASCAVFSRDGLKMRKYWELKAEEFEGGAEEAVKKTRRLLTDAIRRQLVSDVPLCTLLSGGVDSSIISAVAAEHYAERGEKLSTYSFEYEGNKESFKASIFQPQGDDSYAAEMAEFIGSGHEVLTAPTEKTAELLFDATLARDMPGQSDIDSSLLYFCSLIKKRHTVAISGECADEVFGGYPWFYRKEMLENPFFPWAHEPMARAALFRSELIRAEEGYEYLRGEYAKMAEGFPRLDSDSDAMLQSRKATWLSVNLFMTNLLERKDRMSMRSAVEVRVPFADHRILEYVYNVPWEIKFAGGVEKALLRDAMGSYLPESILGRKKSPYPKTHNPGYEALVTKMLLNALKSPDSRLAEICDRKKIEEFLRRGGGTWFGQLMSKPQLIAWLLQLEYWLSAYDVSLLL